ncbi:hypothetical protein V8C42DRAFT_287691 [Trichoderma barbatum]
MAHRAHTGVRFRSYPPAQTQGTTTAANADELDSDAVKLISYQAPALVAGTYTASFTQSIAAPDGTSDTLHSEQQFAVRAPQLRLDPNVDVHSVFPAPGHSEYANTLPHIVFNNPELPWERVVSHASADSFNKSPWVAVLTFTEDELNVPPDDLKRWRIDTEQGPAHANSVKAGDLREPNAPGLVSPVQHIEREFNDNDTTECILISPDMFKNLFGSYANGATTPMFNGKADLAAFSYLAHVRSVHPHAMASTSSGDTELKLSLVLGHRVAPIGLQQPTKMLSHVVSLEGVDKVDLSNGQVQYIGLISLHSWTWMALPPDHGDFICVMENLGKSIQPLRMRDDLSAIPADPSPPNDHSLWLHNRIRDGYLLKPFTSSSGETSTVLFRGPFTPTLPTKHLGSVKPSSTTGTDLRVVDSKTGLLDISYQSAWQLGRLLAAGDAAFNTSLLRLRGRIHAEATKLVREKADSNFVTMSEFTAQLSSAVDYIVKADQNENIKVGRMNATLRWCNGWPHPITSPDPTTKLGDVMDTPEYKKEIENVTRQLTRSRGNGPGSDIVYNEENDPKSHDWANVLAWIMDVLFSDKMPLHYLISDPESLPRESIRTFFVDPVWLECVVDGALSLSSYFQRSDAIIMRELKNHINEYLRAPQNALNGKTPRLPKWGFLLRSIAVSSFPDLRIEAPLKPDDKSGQSEILFMQRISEEVIMCLTDRIPGEPTFTKVVISQPGHQQGFAFGNIIDEKHVAFSFKRLPTKSGASLQQDELKQLPMVWNHERKENEALPVFDWQNRTIILCEFAKQCMAALKKPGYFEWDNGSPSSILSTQLARAAFRLEIDSALDPALQQCLADSTKSPWLVKDGCRQIDALDATRLETQSSVANPASTIQPIQTAPALPHVEIPVDHRPEAQRSDKTASTSSELGTKRSATDLPRYDYSPYFWYEQHWLHFSNDTNNSHVRYFQPNIDCFPLHLGKNKEIRLQPYITAPMDVVFTTTGITNSSFFSFDADLIEWLIPVHCPAVTLTKDFDDKVHTFFRIDGTADHPQLPTVEPINLGCKWVYDTRLVHGTNLEYSEFERDQIATQPNQGNLHVFLVIRARSRDNPYNDINPRALTPVKRIDASFLLKGVSWHLPCTDKLGDGMRYEYDMKFLACFRNTHLGLVCKSFVKEYHINAIASANGP